MMMMMMMMVMWDWQLSGAVLSGGWGGCLSSQTPPRGCGGFLHVPDLRGYRGVVLDLSRGLLVHVLGLGGDVDVEVHVIRRLGSSSRRRPDQTKPAQEQLLELALPQVAPISCFRVRLSVQVRSHERLGQVHQFCRACADDLRVSQVILQLRRLLVARLLLVALGLFPLDKGAALLPFRRPGLKPSRVRRRLDLPT